MHNLKSAQVSVPTLVRPAEDGFLIWRTDLIKTKPYWTGKDEKIRFFLGGRRFTGKEKDNCFNS